MILFFFYTRFIDNIDLHRTVNFFEKKEKQNLGQQFEHSTRYH